ncbi:MAG: carboxypeptidase regulatory-like domain-containing protein [Proteobacteria bacterium]|nr:carboxypeptidase regulatory-like domain-containing protein [Pseudomonadota bacterium]
MTRTRLGLALTLVALAVAMIWFFGPSGEDRPGEQRPGAESVARTDRQVGSVAPAGAVSAPAQTAPRPPTNTPIRLIPAVVSDDRAVKNGVFTGRVIDWATGHSVPGAEVTFARDGTATTVGAGPDGQFVFKPAESGMYRLAAATADGYLPYAPNWGHSPIELVARSRVRIDGIVVYLRPAIDYTGVVVSPNLQPVEGALVRLLNARSGERALDPITAEFTTDQRGEFVFHAPDNALFEATHPEYGPGRARVNEAVQVSHKLEIKLGERGARVPARSSLAGTVVDSEGNPVAEALLRAVPIGMRSAARWVPQTLSDPDGRFEFSDIDSDVYRLAATRDGFAPASVVAEAGDRDIKLRLDPGAVIRGRVVGDTGSPVVAFTVAVLQKPAPLREIVVKHVSVFDGDGQFRVGGLVEGVDYHVRAMAYGFATSPSHPARASADLDRASQVTISLQRGGILSGKVVSAGDRQPLQSAKVTIEDTIGDLSSALPMSATVSTGEDGSFELAGLTPGLASVMVTAYNHHPRIISGLQVANNAHIGPLNIELTPIEQGEKPKIELAGIGAMLAAGEDGLIIQQVIEGGGARDAGLIPGDVILAVDGGKVLDIGFQGAIQRIRGPAGSSVRLTVRRAEGNEAEIVAIRKKIRA